MDYEKVRVFWFVCLLVVFVCLFVLVVFFPEEKDAVD